MKCNRDTKDNWLNLNWSLVRQRTICDTNQLALHLFSLVSSPHFQANRREELDSLYIAHNPGTELPAVGSQGD